jgi:hypothetical protein
MDVARSDVVGRPVLVDAEPDVALVSPRGSKGRTQDPVSATVATSGVSGVKRTIPNDGHHGVDGGKQVVFSRTVTVVLRKDSRRVGHEARRCVHSDGYWLVRDEALQVERLQQKELSALEVADLLVVLAAWVMALALHALIGLVVVDRLSEVALVGEEGV